MITVAFLNQKGGVGKTSLCHHLAGALADLGKTVLLVDYDPQASLTQGLLGSDEAELLPIELTAAAVVAGEGPDPLDLVRDHEASGVSFVAGSGAVGEWNVANPYREDAAAPELKQLRRFLEATGQAGAFAAWRAENPEPGSAAAPNLYHLRRFLAEVVQERAFDFALVDCPPNLQACAAQALEAAEFLAIPSQLESYGAQGLRPVLDFYECARECNPCLKLAGIVTNMRRPTKLHTTYDAKLRRLYGDRVFAAEVPLSTTFPEAVEYRLPITRFDPRSKPAEAVRALADEFIARTGGGLPS